MSRAYCMFVRVRDYKPDRVPAIKEAAERVWPFEGWLQSPEELTACADSCLCGGQTEREFAEELAQEIWAAHQGFCPIDVTATFLEDLPHEDYYLEADDYQRLMSLYDAANEGRVAQGEHDG